MTEPVEQPDEVSIEPGDYIGVRPDVKVKMTPRALNAIGWPNRFRVILLFENEGKPHALLHPCCHVMTKPTQAGGRVDRCGGHPLEYFEKILEPRTQAQREGLGEKGIRVTMPWLGEIVNLDFDEEKEALDLKILEGDPLEIRGWPATALYNLISGKL